MAMGSQSAGAESRCGAGHDPWRAALPMGGSGERREQKFEGRSKNSKQDLGGRRSETEMKRRRAIVYRASGRPSRVEVYMQEGGLHSNRAAASDQLGLRACDGGGSISHPVNPLSESVRIRRLSLVHEQERKIKDDYLGWCYALSSAAYCKKYTKQQRGLGRAGRLSEPLKCPCGFDGWQLRVG